MNVAILGVTGYSGMVLYRLLKSHPKINKIQLYGSGKETQVLSEVAPAFAHDTQTIMPFDAAAIMAENACLFCATPSGVSAKLMAEFIQAKFPVIDLSGDFRLHSAAQYATWYGQEQRQLPDMQQISYGLSEFNGKLQAYIANPGCYATATLLALAPLAQAGLLDPQFIVVDAKSGVSGAGKKLSDAAHYPFINENAQVYRLNRHQHIPEIMQQLKAWDKRLTSIQFSTTLLPITKGIMVNSYAKLRGELSQSQIENLYHSTYQHSPFVRFRGATLPTIKDVVGSNFCDIGVVWNPHTQILSIVSVIDNLLKGAAGQALQNFNQFFGFAETLGLPQYPQYP